MNNEDINEHYWDGAMMRLVDEYGNWNDIRISKDNIRQLLRVGNNGPHRTPVIIDIDMPAF